MATARAKKGTGKITKRVEQVRLGDLELLPINARYMKHETYQRLVANIRRDGCLTQTPFAVKNGKRYLVLSGNHRVKAGIDALGEDHVDDVMLTDDPLPEVRRKAIQLSHNAIVGEDDPATLAQLYDSIDDLDWRSYSGLDDQVLALLEQLQIAPLSEADLAWRSVQMVFLPEELEKVAAAWEAARPAVLTADEVWLASRAEHSAMLDALDDAGKSYAVRNVATQLAVVLQVFETHLADLADAFKDHGDGKRKGDRVPLSAVVGVKGVPAHAANTIRKAAELAQQRGEIDEPWELLARLAEQYLERD
jgi:hypothetical protein